MSRNMKIVLGVVAGLLLLGCLGVMAMGFLGARMFSGAMDPAKAGQVAAQIADYHLPQGYREVMGLDLMGAKTVVIGPEGMLTTGQAGGLPAGTIFVLVQLPP